MGGNKNSDHVFSKEKVLGAALHQLKLLRAEKEARELDCTRHQQDLMPVLKLMSVPGVTPEEKANLNTWAFQYGSLASFVYFWGDKNPRIVACNRSFCRLLGLDVAYDEPRLSGEVIRWSDLVSGGLSMPIAEMQPCLDGLY